MDLNLSKKNTINKILVIRLSSMGDVVLTTPLVRSLRREFPNARIDFLLNKSFSEIYKFNPNIDNLILYDRELSKQQIIKDRDNYLKEQGIAKYDLIIDLQKNKRSKAWTAGISENIKRVEKNRLHKLSLVYLKKPRLESDFHVVKNYLATASEYGLKADEKGCEIFTDKGDYPKIQNQKPLIAFAPAAQHFTKQWLPEKFIELADMLSKDYQIVLLGGKADKEVCQLIQDKSEAEFFDYSGSNSIIQTYSTVKQCSAIVTNDTGVMHIASAADIPIIALFGSTVPALGFTPYNVKHKILEVKDLKCRPCTHIGKKKCPKGHFRCMTEINAKQVYNSLLELL